MTLAPHVIHLMREAIRRRLAGPATVREAAAEARGIAARRSPSCPPEQLDEAVRAILSEIDDMLPDMAPIEPDARLSRRIAVSAAPDGRRRPATRRGTVEPGCPTPKRKRSLRQPSSNMAAMQ
ncbi:MAG TPA: hypothetical protein VNZ61_15730 [Roseomonas sp.]|nr:hypothetical protein [Roseomonas sp.]